MHFLTSFVIATAASVAYGLSPQACQDVAPAQKNLTDVKTAEYIVSGQPFGIVYATQQKDIAFVALNKGAQGNSLGVLNTSTFPPSLQHEIPFITRGVASSSAFGVALTHDGKNVMVAGGYGAVIFDTDAAAAVSKGTAIAGTLNGTTNSQQSGKSAIEITLSPDDTFAFVSQEYNGPDNKAAGNVDVFQLENSDRGKPVGFLTLSYAVVGTALSPDNKTLYAASELSSPDAQTGLINMIDVGTLEQSPEKALRGNVSAGCQPVRTLVSSDGKTLWVTARGSNQLLAFDTGKLASNDSDNALIAAIQVGTAPVGLTFAKNESLILTADSNRFNRGDAHTGISVVDVQAALSGKDAMLGSIPTGQFPREFATSPDGKYILVSDFVSKQVQAIDVSTLPSAAGDTSTSGASLLRGSPVSAFCLMVAFGVFA